MKVQWVVAVSRGSIRLILPLCASLVACTDAQSTIDAIATDSIAAPEINQKPSAQGSQPLRPQDDPFLVFALPTVNDASATSRSTPVWLVNAATQTMIVTAAGGAEKVVVDTVGAADSVLVWIETRARTIELTARSEAGASMGSITLSMDSVPKRAAFPH